MPGETLYMKWVATSGQRPQISHLFSEASGVDGRTRVYIMGVESGSPTALPGSSP